MQMSRPKVFIDGHQGSTGLRINSLLRGREDLEFLTIEDARRKDQAARQAVLQEADFAILCLPDAASEEAVQLIGEAPTRVVDTSSGRRLESGWTYGLPELSPEQRSRIRDSARVANPGCYPQSYILGVRPLIKTALLSADTAFTVNAVSGYSGGGRQMVETYQATPPAGNGDAGIGLCLYGLDGTHKHLPEMKAFSLATKAPLFIPSVDHTICGMLVSTPLHASVLNGKTAQDIYEVWQGRYANEPFINVYGPQQTDKILRDGKFLDLTERAHSNNLDLMVFASRDGGAVIVGRLDNLGKGAAGNAVQCLNIMIGQDERVGLTDEQGRRAAS